MPIKVLIGLGSNLNSPVEQIQTAIRSISSHNDIELLKTSSFYESLPQGPQDQARFINAVILIATSLKPTSLLLTLQDIERSQGKIKVRHWGERCIDLDILFIEQQIINQTNPDLIVPHPHALNRDFVLLPACEIEPDWQLADKSVLKDYLSTCIRHDIKKVVLSS